MQRHVNERLLFFLTAITATGITTITRTRKGMREWNNNRIYTFCFIGFWNKHFFRGVWKQKKDVTKLLGTWVCLELGERLMGCNGL